MIIKRLLTGLSMLTCFSFSHLAQAEIGLYVGIGVGLTSIEDDGFIDDTSGGADDWDDTGTAYRFLAGYKFSDNFSVEWSNQNYDYDEYSIDAVSDVGLQAWHISAIAAYPLYESPMGRMDVFGKIGFGEAEFSYQQAQFGSLAQEQTSESILLGGLFNF